MYSHICNKCWASPCICGEQFKNSTTDHILLLMDGLMQLLEQRDIKISTTVNGTDIKSYLLSKNRGLCYEDNSTLLSILEEGGYNIPNVYRKYILTNTLASDCFRHLKDSLVLPYKTAFAVVMYVNSLVYTDNSLQYFFFRILNDYTCLFEIKKIDALINYTDDHESFCKNLYQVIHQTTILLKENLVSISKEWLLAWSVLTRVQSFYDGDLNIKFQAIKEIVELISGNVTLSKEDVFLKPKNMVDELDNLSQKDYMLFEIDDDDLLRFFLNKDEIKQPYFGMLKAH